MSSVSQRITEIMPYLDENMFRLDNLIADVHYLGEGQYYLQWRKEVLEPWEMSLLVNYASRYFLMNNPDSTFSLAINTYKYVRDRSDQFGDVFTYINNLKIDNMEYSIPLINEIIKYIFLFRGDNYSSICLNNVKDVKMDEDTLKNVIDMVKRVVKYFKNDLILYDNLTFEGGYTNDVDSGDTDFVTKDCIWNFKVLRGELYPKHILQLLMYYIMAKHAGGERYESITKAGIINPRLNKVYIFDIEGAWKKNLRMRDVLRQVEQHALNYSFSDCLFL
jgi:hypothetical protein